MKCKTLLICLAVYGLFSVESYGQEPEFSEGRACGKVDHAAIHEASGLVASTNFPGYFWTHNDSGDDARLFLIDDSARHRATFYLGGISARDWEDIGRMERQGRSYLLIGDIGDNAGQYDDVRVYRLEEPTPDKTLPIVDTIPNERIQSFVLTYEDGPRDAEALFYDPLDAALYVISKRELEVGVYRTALPDYSADTLMLRKVRSLPHTFITGADIQKDGSELLAKNLLEVFYWKRKANESIGELLGRPAMKLPYKPEPQGEAIAFDVGGSGYYTLSEKAFGLDAILYFYPRKTKEIPED